MAWLGLLGLIVIIAALWRPNELRAAVLSATSVVIFLNGLFAGGNLDPIGGLLGLPALLGFLAAGFALIESKRWGRAAVYYIVGVAAGIAVLQVSYAIAEALGPAPRAL